jgi:hypothetical protein
MGHGRVVDIVERSAFDETRLYVAVISSAARSAPARTREDGGMNLRVKLFLLDNVICLVIGSSC